MECPKCTCFEKQKGQDHSPGDRALDTMANDVMVWTIASLEAAHVCEEAEPYFVATLAASVLMVPGVIKCLGHKGKPLDTELITKMAVELLPSVEEVVRQRMALSEYIQSGRKPS